MNKSELKDKVSKAKAWMKKTGYSKSTAAKKFGIPEKALSDKEGMTHKEKMSENAELNRMRKLAGLVSLDNSTSTVGTMYQIRDTLNESSADDRARYDASEPKNKKVTLKKAPWEKEEVEEDSSKDRARYDASEPKNKKVTLKKAPWEKEDVKETEGRPYVCVHAKKGKHECHANSSYEAAKKAAAHWKLKSTAGIDAYLADVTHIATEASKPDFADIDSDGDKKEPMKKAAKDKKELKTEQEQMREWANSIYQNYEDRGHYQEQPDGETVDLSLRRYLNAKAQPVKIEEDYTVKGMMSVYKKYKNK